MEESSYTEFCTSDPGLHRVKRGDVHYEMAQRFGLYRWHITVAIRFEKDLKVTIQALGWRDGGRYLPLAYVACAIDKPECHQQHPSVDYRFAEWGHLVALVHYLALGGCNGAFGACLRGGCQRTALG